jgi:hypothetical protein
MIIEYFLNLRACGGCVIVVQYFVSKIKESNTIFGLLTDLPRHIILAKMTYVSNREATDWLEKKSYRILTEERKCRCLTRL